MKKIDIHLHVNYDKELEQEGGQFTTARAILKHMDSLGIEKGILLSGGRELPTHGTNEGNQRLCNAFPDRFSWMCDVDAAKQGEVYDLLLKYKELGAVGIGEFMTNVKISDPMIQEVFAAAERLQMPVLFHMSPQVGFSYGIVDDYGLPLLEEALQTYPGLKLLGHSQGFWAELDKNVINTVGGRMDTGEGPVTPGRVPELLGKYKNLYGDISAGSGSNAIMRDPEYGAEFLETFQDQLVFGTDTAMPPKVRPLAAFMEELMEQGKLSRQACEKIFYKNAEYIFGGKKA